MRFATEITLTGPMRAPAQMLADQEIDGHASVHDRDTAATLGLQGAPIEAPTHFSQFDPLAFLLWGPGWFEQGCISGHFQTMVVEGEQVQASLSAPAEATSVKEKAAANADERRRAAPQAHGSDIQHSPPPSLNAQVASAKALTVNDEKAVRIEAHKADGTPVLAGTASVGPVHPESELDARRAAQGDPGELFIVDRLQVGMRGEREVVAMTYNESNGAAYPFSLAEKLARITEPHPWYTPEGALSSPWGRQVVPMEMISVLAHKSGVRWAVRSPALGLFLDLEIRLLAGPVFVAQDYALDREVVGLSQSRRTESYWTRTTLSDIDSGEPVATVLLHSGVFKESYPGYPKERLT